MSTAALPLIASAASLVLILSGCPSSSGSYRASRANAPTLEAVEDRLPVRMVVQGVTQVRWVRADRVEEVLNSVPGLIAMRRGTDDLVLRLRGRENPTVMIDGVHALAADLLLLYPWEIGTIEIQQDVPSTAVYGALGSNGVIRVTTKRTRQAEPN